MTNSLHSRNLLELVELNDWAASWYFEAAVAETWPKVSRVLLLIPNKFFQAPPKASLTGLSCWVATWPWFRCWGLWYPCCPPYCPPIYCPYEPYWLYWLYWMKIFFGDNKCVCVFHRNLQYSTQIFTQIFLRMSVESLKIWFPELTLNNSMNEQAIDNAIHAKSFQQYS